MSFPKSLSRPGWGVRHLDLDRQYVLKDGREEVRLIHASQGWKALGSPQHLRVNGQSVQETMLQAGDLLETENKAWIFLEKWLAGRNWKNDADFHYEPDIPPAKPGSWKPEEQPEPLGISVQLPSMPMNSPAPSGSLSAMLMIAAGSLSSMVSMVLSQGVTLNGMLTPVISAASMAGAFGLSGLIQKKKVRRQNQIQEQQALESYQNYLNELFEPAMALQQEQKEYAEHLKTMLRNLDEQLYGCQRNSQWKLPAASTMASCVRLNLPPLSAQPVHPAAASLMEQLREQSFPAMQIQWICHNQVNILDHFSRAQIFWIYLLFNWMAASPKRKFAWLGNVPEEISLLASSFLEGNPLVFETQKQLAAMMKSHPSFEWTVCAMMPVSECPAGITWILCRQDPAQGNVLRACLFGKNQKPSEKLVRNCELSSRFMDESAIPFWEAENLRTTQADLSADLNGVIWDLGQDGPHALVAGTTGSGKSEGLISFLMELAWKNSARLVQFVLIDFKGGSLIQSFVRLPHFAGGLSNLDGQGILRIETALNQLLTKRQKQLDLWMEQNPWACADLDHYNEAHPDEPMSHVIVVADEFGELKSRYPQFLDSLISMARIGRSLGIHLILSTQKPSGLVSDQIWSNTKSKLCFAVNSRQDSLEVLGSDDACKGLLPGQCCLSVSGKELQKGSFTYLKKPWKERGVHKAILEDGSLWERKEEQKSIQEVISEKILERKEKPDPILLPDPALHPDFEGIVIDECFRLKDFPCSCGTSLLLAGKQKECHPAILALAAGKTIWSMHPEDGFSPLSKTGLWLLAQSNAKGVVVTHPEDELCEELRCLLKSNKSLIRAECLEHADYQSLKNARDFETKILLNLEDREEQLAFLGQRPFMETSFPSAIALVNGKQKRIAIGSQNKAPMLCPMDLCAEVSKDHLPSVPYGLLYTQMEDDKPVFARKGQVIVLIWNSRQGKKAADSFIRIQSDLSLAHPQDSCPFEIVQADWSAMDAGQKQQLINQAGLILYFGTDYQNQAACDGLPWLGTIQSECIAIHNQTAACVCPLQYKTS